MLISHNCRRRSSSCSTGPRSMWWRTWGDKCPCRCLCVHFVLFGLSRIFYLVLFSFLLWILVWGLFGVQVFGDKPSRGPGIKSCGWKGRWRFWCIISVSICDREEFYVVFLIQWPFQMGDRWNFLYCVREVDLRSDLAQAVIILLSSLLVGCVFACMWT